MNRPALRPEERADLRGAMDTAITEIRTVLEISTSIGSVLVAGFRAMSALRELREVVDALPELPMEPRPSAPTCNQTMRLGSPMSSTSSPRRSPSSAQAVDGRNRTSRTKARRLP